MEILKSKDKGESVEAAAGIECLQIFNDSGNKINIISAEKSRFLFYYYSFVYKIITKRYSVYLFVKI